jgi:hypothetical protein
VTRGSGLHILTPVYVLFSYHVHEDAYSTRLT